MGPTRLQHPRVAQLLLQSFSLIAFVFSLGTLPSTPTYKNSKLPTRNWKVSLSASAASARSLFHPVRLDWLSLVVGRCQVGQHFEGLQSLSLREFVVDASLWGQGDWGQLRTLRLSSCIVRRGPDVGSFSLQLDITLDCEQGSNCSSTWRCASHVTGWNRWKLWERPILWDPTGSKLKVERSHDAVLHSIVCSSVRIRPVSKCKARVIIAHRWCNPIKQTAVQL